jgi:hypothetical protein
MRKMRRRIGRCAKWKKKPLRKILAAFVPEDEARAKEVQAGCSSSLTELVVSVDAVSSSFQRQTSDKALCRLDKKKRKQHDGKKTNKKIRRMAIEKRVAGNNNRGVASYGIITT